MEANLHHFFVNAWRWKEDLAYNYNLREEEYEIDTTGFEDHSWMDKFEKYRRNRLLIAQCRYGRNGGVDNKKPQYHRVDKMIEYLEEYKNTGNDEILVDVANYCALEFVEGVHPNKHFNATDDKNHCQSI
jgi:hypothetical protein